MIVFINGAFGVGKTTLAKLVVERILNSMLFDPEMVGALLRAVVADLDRPGDFQLLPMWRPLVVETARLLRRTYERDLVIPMTIWRRELFDDLIAGFRQFDPDLFCFRLTASEDTLRARILARPESEGGHAWGLRHVEICVPAFGDPHFGIEISTEGRLPDDLAQEVLAMLNRSR